MASSPATLAKEKGNAAFKAGDFPGAIGYYSAAIVADSSDHTLPLNRAAAYLKLSKNEDAERDSTRVLSLNKNNVKAMFRRGQARTGLQKYEDAQKDYRNALRLDPANETVKTELARVNALLDKGKTKANSKSIPLDVPPSALNANGTTPKRRRIPIKIVEESTPTVPTSSDSLPSSKPAPNVDLFSVVSSRTITKESETSEGPSSVPRENTPKQPHPPKPTTFKDARQARVLKPGGGIFRASGEHTVFDRDRSATPSKSSSPPVSSTAPSTAEDIRTDIPTPPDVPSQVTATHATLPPPASEDGPGKLPWTLFTFLRTWDSLTSPTDRWKLLAALPPSSLPKLCQTSLEPPILVSILTTFSALLSDPGYASQSADLRLWTRAYLVHLARVPRFNTNLMFLSAKEKALAGDVLRKVDAGAELLRSWGV